MGNRTSQSVQKARIFIHNKNIFRAVSMPMVRIRLKPQYGKESERLCYNPLSEGYEPFRYKDFECQVMIDGKKIDSNIVQEYDELNVTFQCPPGEHNVFIYHTVKVEDKELFQINFAGKIFVHSQYLETKGDKG